MKSICLTFPLLLLSAIACKDDDEPRSCDLHLEDPETLTTVTEVVYLAGVSGTGGKITSITYLDANGSHTVNNPTLPWETTASLNAGTKARISAKGTANKGGQINISFVVDEDQIATSCGH